MEITQGVVRGNCFLEVSLQKPKSGSHSGKKSPQGDPNVKTHLKVLKVKGWGKVIGGAAAALCDAPVTSGQSLTYFEPQTSSG